MADLNTFFKVLNFVNAATKDADVLGTLKGQAKSIFDSLSPEDKQKAKDKMDKKKKASGGKVYSKGSGTRKVNN